VGVGGGLLLRFDVLRVCLLYFLGFGGVSGVDEQLYFLMMDEGLFGILWENINHDMREERQDTAHR
jgi:hypothetical protein